MPHSIFDTTTEAAELEIVAYSPVREHYGEIMQAVDTIIERDSFDDRPLRSLKNLCLIGAVGEGLKWTTQSFRRFHNDILEQLQRLVGMGAMFEPDQWAEEKLQFVLERHKQLAQLMGMTPA